MAPISISIRVGAVQALPGISGVGSDMRALHGVEASNRYARLAIDMFCYAIPKELGAMSVAIGGVDQIVFSGGIGEHDTQVRDAISGRLSRLGVALDEARSQGGQGLVTTDSSRCGVQVLPSREDEQISRRTAALCGPDASGITHRKVPG